MKRFIFFDNCGPYPGIDIQSFDWTGSPILASIVLDFGSWSQDAASEAWLSSAQIGDVLPWRDGAIVCVLPTAHYWHGYRNR